MAENRRLRNQIQKELGTCPFQGEPQPKPPAYHSMAIEDSEVLIDYLLNDSATKTTDTDE